MNVGVSLRTDVVIVGAGLGSLVAARDLRASGASVVVLEARDRVGGRTLAGFADDVPVGIGGQWIGGKQCRISALAEELGVKTFPVREGGRTVLYGESGIRSEYEESADVPFSDPAACGEIKDTFRTLSKLMREVPAKGSRTARRVREWDGPDGLHSRTRSPRVGHCPAQERKDAVLECFTRYFGGTRSNHAPTGGYPGFATPGLLTDHGPALRESFGRIHWVGIETAAESEWNGYMEGAVESRERVAREVLSSKTTADDYLRSPETIHTMR